MVIMIRLDLDIRLVNDLEDVVNHPVHHRAVVMINLNDIHHLLVLAVPAIISNQSFFSLLFIN